MTQVRPVSPADLLPRVDWGGWGGGPGGSADCFDDIPNVYLTAYGGTDIPEPTARAENMIGIGEWLVVNGCDFPPGESVAVGYRRPDGETETAVYSADEYGYWRSAWWSLPGEPLGRYDVLAVSASALFDASFQVTEPARPIMTTFCPADGDGLVLLTGFRPNETVLIARYDHERLQESFYVTIGSDGTAFTTSPKEYALIIAIGAETPAKVFADGLGSMAVSAFDFMADGPGGDCRPPG